MNKNYFKDLEDIIICPKTGNKLFYNEEKNIYINNIDNIYYVIENDVPILLKEEAKKIEDK